MYERDKLIAKYGLDAEGKPDLTQKLYIVVPYVMLQYVKTVR